MWICKSSFTKTTLREWWGRLQFHHSLQVTSLKKCWRLNVIIHVTYFIFAELTLGNIVKNKQKAIHRSGKNVGLDSAILQPWFTCSLFPRRLWVNHLIFFNLRCFFFIWEMGMVMTTCKNLCKNWDNKYKGNWHLLSFLCAVSYSSPDLCLSLTLKSLFLLADQPMAYSQMICSLEYQSNHLKYMG